MEPIITNGMLSTTDWILIAQTAILLISLGFIYYQIKSSKKVEQATFEYDIVKDIIEYRAKAHRDNPSFHQNNPVINELITLSGNVDNFLMIRSLQDYFNFIFKLWKQKHLVSDATWKVCEGQIKILLSDKSLRPAWRKVQQTFLDPEFVEYVEKLWTESVP